MTAYQLHVERWGTGCGNAVCKGAKSVCLLRGAVPCDVLFVGEAPGESEDVLGRPFVGPAGKLLDRIVAEAFDGLTLRVAFTNLVGCIPRDEGGGKATEPDATEVKTCRPRLEDVIALCRPRLVVTVGALSTRLCPVPAGADRCAITHPAAILRANIAARGLMAQKCVVALRDAVETPQ